MADGADKVTPSQTRMAMLRLASDLRAIQADPPSGCSASPATEDNLFLWNATIIGPDESPWEGGARITALRPRADGVRSYKAGVAQRTVV